MSVQVSSDVILNMILKSLQLPFDKICRHTVACDLLSILEDAGLDVPSDIAKFVVNAMDDEAIESIKTFYKIKESDDCSN